MMTETPDVRRKRLQFRSWHRGTRELDLIMGRFADRHLPEMTAAELDLYEQILTHPDPDLYNWVAGIEPVPANFINPVMELLVRHTVKEQGSAAPRI